MNWTTKKPVAPGWYWYRSPSQACTIKEVKHGAIGLNVDQWPIDMYADTVEWAGPVDLMRTQALELANDRIWVQQHLGLLPDAHTGIVIAVGVRRTKPPSGLGRSGGHE